MTYCEDCDCPDFMMQVYGDGKFCRFWDEDLESIDPAHTVPCADCEYLEEDDTTPSEVNP